MPSTRPSDAEPARAFLQDRIGLWVFWVFALSFGFYLANIATSRLVQRASPDPASMLLQVGNIDHLLASLTFGGVWTFRADAPRVRAARPLSAPELSVTVDVDLANRLTRPVRRPAPPI